MRERRFLTNRRYWLEVTLDHWLGFLGGSFWFPPVFSPLRTMASNEVTGKPADVVEERRQAYDGDFDGKYCLAKIPRQPEDYDGPSRYCFSTSTIEPIGRCKHHGGAGQAHPENMEPLANMKHGMKATRENLVKDFSDSDQALYDWIVGTWPEAYEIDTSEDPVAEYEFHALAVEIVRAERAEGYIIEMGEDGEKRVFSPTGEEYRESVPHYLVDMLQRQRKLIMKMEDSLGISRKKRIADENAKDATDIMQSFAEVGASLITDSDNDYDPDEWEPDN